MKSMKRYYEALMVATIHYDFQRLPLVKVQV